MTRKGNLFVLSAPSGSGKTTLVQKVVDAVHDVCFSISFTTRPQRGTERDGIDYHFISKESFEEKIQEGDFLEHAEVHGNLYGTSRSETDRVREGGEDILLDIDVQGARLVRKAAPDAITIFIMPPSYQVLESRLRGRKQDSEEAMKVRLEEARREVRHYEDYDYVLINDSVERTAKLLEAIVRAERARPRLLKDRIRPILESFREGG